MWFLPDGPSAQDSDPSNKATLRPKEERGKKAMTEKSTAVQITKETSTPKPFTVENAFDRAHAMLDAIARRAYEIFEGNGRSFGHELDNWFQAEKELLHPVHIGVSETDNALQVKAEVPGFTEKELEINVEPQRLVISGKRETKKEEKRGKAVYSEACSDQILRVIDLPAEVETEKVTATLKDGVLELSLPKAAKARSLRVEPKAA